jgi:hypothetical protein
LGSSQWEIRPTEYRGDVTDAHKSISIAIDGEGFIHMVWNQHDSPLFYRRGIAPGSLEFAREFPMRGDKEAKENDGAGFSRA